MSGQSRVPTEWADIHLIVGASCQELPAISKLAELAPTTPLICFNLKLDVLRGDLGLPAFPPKAVHHEFLCRVKPVYYLRPRSYSLSLSVPPFLSHRLPGRAIPPLCVPRAAHAREARVLTYLPRASCEA